jgi:hypothetical protein
MLIGVLKHALMITSFVLIMMLLIEYINVHIRGSWQLALRKSRFGQYALGAFLGVVPGCLGAFTAVSLYSHRTLSFGTLVAAMIATSGDEAFVMFSMFLCRRYGSHSSCLLSHWQPVGSRDTLFKNQDRFLEFEGHELELHEEESHHCFSPGGTLIQLRQMTFSRAILIAMFGGFLFLLATGMLGSEIWDWKKITFTVEDGFSLFVVLTVPDHFLEQHLWEHVVKKHLARIFFWTFGALLARHFLARLRRFMCSRVIYPPTVLYGLEWKIHYRHSKKLSGIRW